MPNLDDVSPPPRRDRNRSDPREDDAAGPEEPAPEFDPATLLPGAVLMVPNRHWGFEVLSAEDHPGAGVYYRSEAREGVLVQGTDASRVGTRRDYLVVEKNNENGLKKPTAFRLVPRRVRFHKLKLYFVGRQLGRLDNPTLHILQLELARLHPEE